MALDMDEIHDKLLEDHQRINELMQERSAGEFPQDKQEELDRLLEERADLIGMATDDDIAELVGTELMDTVRAFLGDDADTALQKASDMMRGNTDISPQGAVLAVLAEKDKSIDAAVARECLTTTGYRSIGDYDFRDYRELRAESIVAQSKMDEIAKGIAATVPDGLCAKYLEAKGDFVSMEQSIEKLDSLRKGMSNPKDYIPILTERGAISKNIDSRLEKLHTVGADAFSPVIRSTSPQDTMQRFDVARLDDLNLERANLYLIGDERAAIAKGDEYKDLLESIRAQASRDPDGFAAKYIEARDNFEESLEKLNNSKDLSGKEEKSLKEDYISNCDKLVNVVSEAHYFTDASKVEQAKDEVERNGVHGDVTPRMDARAIVDYKALEVAYEWKSGEEFPFAKDLLEDKVDTKFSYLEGIAKNAPDSLSAQYVDAKHQIDDKTAEISKLEERYQSTPEGGTDRTELLHRIDELKAEIKPLENQLHDIELRAGAIVESTKSDSEVDQDRLIAKVYALDKEIQAGGLDAISLGANKLDIDNFMIEIRDIAKDDPQGKCADFAREYDARRSMDTEVFNARQEVVADREFAAVDGHHEVKSLEVEWSNFQEHVDRLGSEAQICVEGFDAYGRIETPPDPVIREQQADTEQATDKSPNASASREPEPTAYEKAKTDYEDVKDKYNFRNFFVCIDRLSYNIEAYKTGQPGDHGHSVSGGDIAMNIIDLLRSNFWDSLFEIGVRAVFDKYYPAKESQDVAKEQGPTVHKYNTSPESATDVNGVFHDDGYIDKNDPKHGVDRGSEQNPGFGRYWGADLTQEVRGRGNDISTTVRNCGRGFTDSVVVDGKMETFKIPPIRLVEMGADHYLIDPFGKTLYSNVTTDSSDMEVQQSYSKPYFETLDISRGRFNGEMLEAGAAAKGMSIDEYKDMLVERCKSDYVDNGLRFFAVHGDYLENNVVLNIHEEIDYTKDKIDFLHGLQLDKEAELKNITAETPNAEARAERLSDEIKVAKACQEDLTTKLDGLRDRLEKVNDTIDAYRSAGEICRSKEFGDDVKFSAVLRGEVTGQGKVDKVSYGIDGNQESRIEAVLDKFNYKYDPNREKVTVEEKVETTPKIDPQALADKKAELIMEYGYNPDKIQDMDYAVEKLGIEKAEENYSPSEWADYMLYREDVDAYIKEQEAAADKPEPDAKDSVSQDETKDRIEQESSRQDTSKDGNGESQNQDATGKEENQDNDKKVESKPEDDKQSQDVESAPKQDKTEVSGSADGKEKDAPSKEEKKAVEVIRPGPDTLRPDLESAKEIGDRIGIDGNKLMAMDALINAYGPDIRDSADLPWDKYDEFIETLAFETGNDPADYYDGSFVDEDEFDDDLGHLIHDALHMEAESVEAPPLDMDAIRAAAEERMEVDDAKDEVTSGQEEKGDAHVDNPPETQVDSRPDSQIDTPSDEAKADGQATDTSVTAQDEDHTPEQQVETGKADKPDENEKSYDVAAVDEGEKQLDNNVDSQREAEWQPGEIRDYGDVVYVDGFCMNHDQLDEYLKGPMDKDDIKEVIDKFIDAGHDGEDSFSFREDFLETSKYRFDIEDVIDAFADKMHDIQDSIDNGEPPSQDTVDMMVDCLCAIRDAAVDDFTENIVSVLDHIDDIFSNEPGVGGVIADKYMDAVVELAEPVLSGFHAYDTEQADIVQSISEKMEMFQYNWDNLDASGFVEAASDLNAVFNGFAEMLTNVGTEFSNPDVDAAAQDLDTGMDAQPMDMPDTDDGLDYLQPEFADTEPDMPEDIEKPAAVMFADNPDAQPDVFDPSLYDTDSDSKQNVDMNAGEEGLDDLDKAADSLSDLGDMLRGIESLSDTMNDLDREGLVEFAGGE